MEHRPLVKVRLYMDVLLSLRGVPGIGVPPIMRETGVRLFLPLIDFADHQTLRKETHAMSRGKDYAEKCSLSLGDKIYFAPNIPPQKLRNALSRYGFGIDADEVVVLIDDTVFGSAREGVIITRDSFQFKEIFNPPDSRRLSEDDELSVEKGFGNRVVKLNGRKIMSLTQADYDDLDCLFEWVNELYHGELDETENDEEDNEEEAYSTTKSDTKICPFCGEEIKAAAIKCRFCGEVLDEAGAITRKTTSAAHISSIGTEKNAIPKEVKKDDNSEKKQSGQNQKNPKPKGCIDENVAAIYEAFEQLTNQQLCCIVLNSGSSKDDITIATDLLTKRNASELLSQISKQ